MDPGNGATLYGPARQLVSVGRRSRAVFANHEGD